MGRGLVSNIRRPFPPRDVAPAGVINERTELDALFVVERRVSDRFHRQLDDARVVDATQVHAERIRTFLDVALVTDFLQKELEKFHYFFIFL